MAVGIHPSIAYQAPVFHSGISFSGAQIQGSRNSGSSKFGLKKHVGSASGCLPAGAGRRPCVVALARVAADLRPLYACVRNNHHKQARVRVAELCA